MIQFSLFKIIVESVGYNKSKAVIGFLDAFGRPSKISSNKVEYSLSKTDAYTIYDSFKEIYKSANVSEPTKMKSGKYFIEITF